MIGYTKSKLLLKIEHFMPLDDGYVIQNILLKSRMHIQQCKIQFKSRHGVGILQKNWSYDKIKSSYNSTFIDDNFLEQINVQKEGN